MSMMRRYLGILSTTSIFIGVADTCIHYKLVYVIQWIIEDLPVYNIWILTSWACGGATSTSSILRDSPAAQHTAALHLMGFPTVSDMAAKENYGKLERKRGLYHFISQVGNDSCLWDFTSIYRRARDQIILDLNPSAESASQDLNISSNPRLSSC